MTPTTSIAPSRALLLAALAGCLDDPDAGGAIDTAGPAADGGSLDGDGGAGDDGTTDGGATDGGSSDGGATDGGSSDGGATDGGAADGGATDDGGTSACGDYSGLDAVGTTWSWELTDDYTASTGISGAWSTTATGRATHEGRDVWETVSEGWYRGPTYDGDYTWTSRTWFACDADGAWISGYAGSYAYSSGGTPISGSYEAVYTAMPLNLPATLAVGDGWTSAGTYVYTDSFGNGFTQSFTADYTVVGRGSLTVPAGTFDVLEIRLESDGSSFYVAPGVGTVATDGYAELVSID